jgi:poly-gamma-glutamate capsule biosynthesis protein CapA/YwtB (metallophosphatase superfamily)
MPRNSTPDATAWPRTAPSAVATTRRVSWFWLALLEVLGVAVAVVHAAAAVSTAVAAAPAARPVRTRRRIGIARIAALTCSSLFEGQNSITALNN